MAGLVRLETKKTNRYKTINLYPIDDNAGLSWKAKGIWVYLISRPPNWEFYLSDLIKRSKDGSSAVRAGIKELQENNYLFIQKMQGPDGQWTGQRWTVTEDPVTLPLPSNPVIQEKPRTEKPCVEKPHDGESNPSSNHLKGVSFKEDDVDNNKEPSFKDSEKKMQKPESLKGRLFKNPEKPIEKSSKKPSKESRTFPRSDCKFITDEYQRIKGIELHGDEFKPVMKELGIMFRNGRKKEDIVSLMVAMEKNNDIWTANWTIHTVASKLPEWVAGKLTLEGSGNYKTQHSQLATNTRPGISYQKIVERNNKRRE